MGEELRCGGLVRRGEGGDVDDGLHAGQCLGESLAGEHVRRPVTSRWERRRVLPSAHQRRGVPGGPRLAPTTAILYCCLRRFLPGSGLLWNETRRDPAGAGGGSCTTSRSRKSECWQSMYHPQHQPYDPGMSEAAMHSSASSSAVGASRSNRPRGLPPGLRRRPRAFRPRGGGGGGLWSQPDLVHLLGADAVHQPVETRASRASPRCSSCSDDEQQYLHSLVSPGEPVTPARTPRPIFFSFSSASRTTVPFPVYGINLYSHMAWNPAAADYYTDFGALSKGQRDGVLRWMLEAPEASERLADWEEDTRAVIVAPPQGNQRQQQQRTAGLNDDRRPQADQPGVRDMVGGPRRARPRRPAATLQPPRPRRDGPYGCSSPTRPTSSRPSWCSTCRSTDIASGHLADLHTRLDRRHPPRVRPSDVSCARGRRRGRRAPRVAQHRAAGLEAGDRHAEGRAGDVVQPDAVEEVDGLRVAAVLAADADLQVGPGRASLPGRDLHQPADAVDVEALERARP